MPPSNPINLMERLQAEWDQLTGEASASASPKKASAKKAPAKKQVKPGWVKESEQQAKWAIDYLRSFLSLMQSEHGANPVGLQTAIPGKIAKIKTLCYELVHGSAEEKQTMQNARAQGKQKDRQSAAIAQASGKTYAEFSAPSRIISIHDVIQQTKLAGVDPDIFDRMFPNYTETRHTQAELTQAIQQARKEHDRVWGKKEYKEHKQKGLSLELVSSDVEGMGFDLDAFFHVNKGLEDRVKARKVHPEEFNDILKANVIDPPLSVASMEYILRTSQIPSAKFWADSDLKPQPLRKSTFDDLVLVYPSKVRQKPRRKAKHDPRPSELGLDPSNPRDKLLSVNQINMRLKTSGVSPKAFWAYEGNEPHAMHHDVFLMTVEDFKREAQR